ncbi:putative ribonuclease H [Amylocarpus encephaloides]|uniref:Ribonuclease H n=1 Tax=Amylocarpus encephaloides TaxID=45428 RepID=A0A9P8CAW9_9HELO|nr:putative ribonuclease H [Amylocarpus encephaloides]
MSEHDINRRVFDENTYGYEMKEDTGLNVCTLASDSSALIINVNGYCHNKGLPDAKAASGVFWLEMSDQNSGVPVPSKYPQTLRSAKLYAIETVLEKFVEGLDNPEFTAGLPRAFSRIVLVVDSPYVVSCVCAWVWEWERWGWRDGEGKRVVDWETLEKIHGHFINLQSRGVEVNLWDVPKERNGEAEEVAKKGLL